MFVAGGMLFADEVVKSTFTSVVVVSDTATYKEIYEPKALIEAKWGRGQGEFGYKNIYNNSFVGGPRDFRLMDNGDICVLDTDNARLIFYTIDGKYSKTVPLEIDYKLKMDDLWLKYFFDKDNNIYLLQENNYFVDKFDSNGRLLKKIIVFHPESHVKEERIEINEQINEYLKDKRAIMLNKPHVKHGGVDIEYNNDNTIYLVVSTGKEGLDEGQVYTEYTNLVNIGPESKWGKIKGAFQKVADKEQYVLNYDTITLRGAIQHLDKQKKVVGEVRIDIPAENMSLANKYHVKGKIYYRSKDDNDNYYIVRWYTNWYPTYFATGEIYKFDRSGVLVSKIELWQTTDQIRNYIIDKSGDCYLLVLDKNNAEKGIKIINYYIK
jgi:hypothetical protein